MQPNISLTKTEQEQATTQLKTILADTALLYQKMRNYHWNVRGIHFNDLHAFFETLYTELETSIDDIAERIRALGGNAPGTLQEFLELTRLKEEPRTVPHSEEMIQKTLVDYEKTIQHLRETIQQGVDVGTEDFLTGMLQTFEKRTWMIRSMLEE